MQRYRKPSTNTANGSCMFGMLFESVLIEVNPSYLRLGYINPTKLLMANFTSLVSLTQVSVQLFFNRFTINNSVH